MASGLPHFGVGMSMLVTISYVKTTAFSLMKKVNILPGFVRQDCVTICLDNAVSTVETA